MFHPSNTRELDTVAYRIVMIEVVESYGGLATPTALPSLIYSIPVVQIEKTVLPTIKTQNVMEIQFENPCQQVEFVKK